MNIQSKLNVLTRGMYLAFFIIGISFVWAYYNIDKALTHDRYASETMRIISGLSYQFREIVLHNDIHSLTEWKIRQKKLTEHLLNRPNLTPVMNRFVLGIERRNRGVESLILALYKNGEDLGESNKLMPIKRHLGNKLFLQIEGIREDSMRLITISQNEIEQVFYIQSIGFLVIVTVFIFPITIGSSRLAKNIKWSLRRLIKGTVMVTKGKFTQRLEGFSDDEFGVFANHFNLMISHLNETTISRDSLQDMVNERTSELQELSETDALTKIHNRRFYNHRIIFDIATAKRTKHSLSLMMIDVDYFKRYNDTYGHDMGDVVLSNVAKVIAKTLPRATDSVSRFGGEEFIVLLPSTDAEGAFVIAERIRACIKTLVMAHSSSDLGILTVSIGVSSMHSDTLNEVDLLKQADLALYEAKNNGRNQAVIFSE